MIQCPLCQMINDDQTRFCAECGARLGPAPGGPPAQGPPGPPQGKFSSPMLGGHGTDNPEVDRLRKMSNQDQNQSRPPEKPAKKLRSPLLASEEDDFDEQPAPQSRGRGGNQQGQSRQHLHSPLLGDAGEDNYVTPQHTGGRGGPLHSPLLGDAGSHGVHHEANSPSGKHLHSPLLGDAGSHGMHQDAPPQQGGSGKHHLHSPLLGGGDDEDDYYEEPATRKGGLHSPILGGGGGGQTGGRSGLRSPMFAAAGAGGQQDYYDEYEEDPYADEDNPNILRSPLLSSKMNEAPEKRAPRPKPPQQPGMPHQAQPVMPPGPAPQNYPPHQPPAPQSMATAHQAQHGPAFQPDANQATLPPGNQLQEAMGRAASGPPQTPPGMGQMPPQAQMQQPQLQQPQMQPPHMQQQMPHPQAQMPPQPQMPQAQQPMGSMPAASKPAAPPASPPSQFNVVQNQNTDEEFPDMTKFRRGDSSDSRNSQSQSQSPVLPVSMPLAAGIPDPASFVPPEEKQVEATVSASFVPKQALSAAAPAPAPMEAPTAPPPEPALKEQAKSAPKPKLHSKLLADDAADDEFDSPFPAKGAPSRVQNSYAPPAAPASPLPKMMGGVAIFLALLKLPLLMTYLPAITNPQYTWTAVDLLATSLALVALGLAAIMSRN